MGLLRRLIGAFLPTKIVRVPQVDPYEPEPRWVKGPCDHGLPPGSCWEHPVYLDPQPSFPAADRTIEQGTRAGATPLLMRCESRKREGSRSWRCIRPVGHMVGMSGTRRTLGHVDTSGRRHW